MKVELDIIDNNLCNSFFEDGKLDRGIENSQICAGVLAGSKDTCNGGESTAHYLCRKIFVVNNKILQIPGVRFMSQRHRVFVCITSSASRRSEARFAVRRTHPASTRAYLRISTGLKSEFGDETEISHKLCASQDLFYLLTSFE